MRAHLTRAGQRMFVTAAAAVAIVFGLGTSASAAPVYNWYYLVGISTDGYGCQGEIKSWGNHAHTRAKKTIRVQTSHPRHSCFLEVYPRGLNGGHISYADIPGGGVTDSFNPIYYTWDYIRVCQGGSPGRCSPLRAWDVATRVEPVHS